MRLGNILLAILALSVNSGLAQASSTSAKTGKHQRAQNKWIARNPLTDDLPRGPVISGNGVSVARGLSSIVVFREGASWKRANREASAIAFGNGIFTAVWGKEILTSSDGLSWTQDQDTSHNLKSIAFGDRVFVAVGDAILTSPDGKRWTERPADSSQIWHAVVYGNHRFVAVSDFPGGVITSPDGVTWSVFDSIYSERYSVSFGNGLFILRGEESYESPDGVRWTRLLLDGKNSVGLLGLPAHFLNNQFIVYNAPLRADLQGAFWISPDYSTWTRVDTDLPGALFSLTFFKGKYFAGVNTSLFSSPDLSHWTPENNVTARQLNSVVYGQGIYVAVGGSVLTSPDAVIWKANDSLKTELARVIFAKNIFVAIGSNGTIFTSPDGNAWTGRTSGTENRSISLTFGNGLFVIGRGDGLILTSADGVKWTQMESGVKGYVNIVTAANGWFAGFAGYTGDTVLTSRDGKRWEKQRIGINDHGPIYSEGKRFVVCARDDRDRDCLFISREGKWWKVSSVSAYEQSDARLGQSQMPDGVKAVIYGDGQYVAVGDFGWIYTLKAPPPEVKDRFAADSLEAPVRPFAHRVFVGELERKYGMIMTLSSDGKLLTGEYRYLTQKKPLTLKGAIDSSGEFTLIESTETGAVTGRFSGKIMGALITGLWRSPDGAKSLLLSGEETTDKKLADRQIAIRAQLAQRVGTYEVVSGSGSAYANETFDFYKENGEWVSSGSYLNQCRRELTGTDYVSNGDFDFIRIEIAKDLSIALYADSKRLMNIPFLSNPMVYFDIPFLARNIPIDFSHGNSDSDHDDATYDNAYFPSELFRLSFSIKEGTFQLIGKRNTLKFERSEGK